jgi:hypothetical protein
MTMGDRYYTEQKEYLKKVRKEEGDKVFSEKWKTAMKPHLRDYKWDRKSGVMIRKRERT